ncbi:TIGR04282 family arsenosugar biosynthesis glycosyltransferase [Nocardioides acrostichi]|uniref:DUF2064 domain-containing protein n=1 Tax=Nocardioides acrostichi TaxID=2784339 RepID=A0A930V1E5_9ACTN|nr:DUF2064 domain-containing protein [Nocardioides acrostichi]MBF4162269.1 DUF2064 domain-containing protein [Nocardioides acrostichi]
MRALVVAKAPVTGRVKTRLGADVGLDVAADMAAAALLDTVRCCTEAFGSAQCHLSLEGDLAGAVRGAELLAATQGWTLHTQVGDGFDERLARAHADVAASGPGPVVQVGMDTPHITPSLLREVVEGLDLHDAVLGPAEDGGWWVLALRDPAAAACLTGVPMSTPSTGVDTRTALAGAGLSVGDCPTLVDVDTVADADLVASQAPGTLFARAWAARREHAGVHA